MRAFGSAAELYYHWGSIISRAVEYLREGSLSLNIPDASKLFTLGADPHLPRGLFEGFLWDFFKITLGVKIKHNPGGFLRVIM